MRRKKLLHLKQKNNKIKWLDKIIPVVLFCLLLNFNFFFIAPVSAATADAKASMYFTPATGTYAVDSQFTVAVKIDTDGEEVNAAEGTISFKTGALEVVSLEKTGSILGVWVPEQPSFNNTNGTIVFSGVVKPGTTYKGASGQVLAVTFKAKAVDTVDIRFSYSAILANDGKGTNILKTTGSGSYAISPEEVLPPAGQQGPAPGEQKPAGAGYNQPNIISLTHPDQAAWYNKNTVDFTWEIPDGATAVSMAFDNLPGTEPPAKAAELVSEKEYKDIADGVWYFHLKYKDGKKWGDVAHYKVMIDTAPPELLEVKAKQVPAGDWPELELASKDKDSGVQKYKIIVGNLENQAVEIGGEETVFAFSGLNPGGYLALVNAIDNAGNERVVTVSFSVEPIESPGLEKYAEEIKPSDQFFITGSSIGNGSVNIFFEKDASIVASGTTMSDANGNWFYVHDKVLPNGRYIAYAEALNDKGLKSYPSNKVTFLVSPPIFATIGSWVINYFTVFVSLLFMIILIIISIMYLARMVKKRLKKETVEVEYVLHRNIVDLNEIIDEEFADLNKLAGTAAYNKERIKLKQKIKNLVIEAEKKIMKEVKDVENMLK